MADVSGAGRVDRACEQAGRDGRKLCPKSSSSTLWIAAAYGASASGVAVRDMSVLL
jgi:hypothetical protein